MEASEPIFKCYNCGEELVFDVKIGRRDMCPNCYAYLHCCYNCKFWDKNVHNQCTENQGEFIRDRAEGNFCLYFTFKPVPGTEGITEEQKAKAKIESLFGGPKVETSPRTADDAKARLEKLFSK
ncbi:MAG TPA: hypothetical protein PKH54_11905 [Myxococcota bacterium]|nr:hypothetical protein [Myxococcota bacterium]HOA14356.1 hypothetical protein [Myxococcota bacterium]HOD00642.1 hypothetical protein [Myxococcota bacterium]HOH77547.1 hypothetical protein [Myxococcota bacterium]HPV04806.1 hypothetical protein [Myxococcota bacterium]